MGQWFPISVLGPPCPARLGTTAVGDETLCNITLSPVIVSSADPCLSSRPQPRLPCTTEREINNANQWSWMVWGFFPPACVFSAGLIIMEINYSCQVPEGLRETWSIQPDLQYLIYCYCNIQDMLLLIGLYRRLLQVEIVLLFCCPNIAAKCIFCLYHKKVSHIKV